jgi:hypothetical protein
MRHVVKWQNSPVTEQETGPRTTANGSAGSSAPVVVSAAVWAVVGAAAVSVFRGNVFRGNVFRGNVFRGNVFRGNALLRREAAFFRDAS